MNVLLILVPLLGWGLAQGSEPAPPPYQVSLSPERVSMAPGGSTKATLAVLPEGFTGTLPVNITGLPPGVSYSPASITVSDPQKNATLEITFTAGANTPTGVSEAVLRVGGRQQSFGVVVDPAAEPPSNSPVSLEAIWEQVRQWGSTACTTINAFSLESVRWVCTIYRTLNRAVELWDEVKYDFEMLKKEGFITAVGYAVDALGAEMGLAGVNITADQIERDFLAMRRNYRQTVAKISNWMARLREKQIEAIRENPYPNGSPSWWRVEILKLNPNLRAAEEETARRVKQVLKHRSKVEENNSKLEEQIEEAVEQAKEELAEGLQVTNPLNGLPNSPINMEGEAEQVVRRAKEANSTREVLEILVDAQAKIMRQNLANSQNVVQAVRETAVQQSYTTQQLTKLIDIEVERRFDELTAWEGELEVEMARLAEEVESQTANLRMLANLARAAACFGGVSVPGPDGETTCVYP